MFATSVINLS